MIGKCMYASKKGVICPNFMRRDTHTYLDWSSRNIGPSRATMQLHGYHVTFFRLQQGIFIEEAAHSGDGVLIANLALEDQIFLHGSQIRHKEEVEI